MTYLPFCLKSVRVQAVYIIEDHVVIERHVGTACGKGNIMRNGDRHSTFIQKAAKQVLQTHLDAILKTSVAQAAGWKKVCLHEFSSSAWFRND